MTSTLRFDAIGTGWQIDTEEPVAGELERALLARTEAYDAVYSRFRDDSLVSRLAREGGRVRFPSDAVDLFDVYRRLYEATDGAMSPLVGRTLESLGYDRQYSLRPEARIADVPTWEDAFSWDGEHVEAARPITIDVGAAGKGHLVDILSTMLQDAGHERFTVDGSGDIRHRGEPLRVALEDPRDPSKAIGVVRLGTGALASSATNRRAWGDGLHHVIDATTGLPTTRYSATWALAETALEADALATALFFADPARLRSGFDFTYVRMTATARAERSPDLEGELFT